MPRSFSGSSSNYLDFGSSFPIGGTMCVGCWVWFNTTASAQFLIGRAESFSPDLNPGGCWELGLDGSGKVFFAVWPNGSTNRLTATSAETLQPGRWYHVLGQQGSNVEIFLDGVRDGLTAGSRTQNDVEPLRIGQARTGGSPLNGFVAHAAAWNTNLTFVEVFQLAQGALPNSVREGRLYWWVPLDAPGSAIDRSVRHLDGAENGSVPPVRDPQAIDLAYGSTVFTPSAPGVIVEEIDPPFGWAGATAFEPTLVGPEVLDTVPLGLVGATGFEPAVLGELTPPVGYAEPTTPGVTLFEGSLPPFVPPSLPPTIPPGSPTGPGVPLPPLSSGGLGGIRFYQGPPWRWVVTDLDSQTLTFLDRLAFEAEVKYVLDRSSSASLSVPADNPEVNIDHTDGFPFVNEGDRLLYGFRREGGTGEAGRLWVCRFAGTILQTEDTGLTENARTILRAVDPWQRLYQRPMVNIDGEFPDEAGFFSFNDTQVGTIALTFLRNTIINHGDLGIDMGDLTPAWSEDLDGNPVQLPGTAIWGGPYGQLWGAERYKSEYETTTQIDIAFQQGMSVGEVWDQLIQTGLLDIVLTPIYDPINRPGYTHEVAIYNRVGAEASNAVMAWDKPSRNLVRINHVKDGFKRANTVRYHEHQGGPPVAGGIPISYGPSIARYGEYWATQFFPGRIEEAALAFAELQLELRANGVDTVQIEPTNERAPFLFTEWFLGDTVPIFASERLRESIAGFQRVYGITLRIDENAYERIPMVAGSPETA